MSAFKFFIHQNLREDFNFLYVLKGLSKNILAPEKKKNQRNLSHVISNGLH